MHTGSFVVTKYANDRYTKTVNGLPMNVTDRHGVIVGILEEDGTVRIGHSTLHHADRFDRKYGRDKAKARAQSRNNHFNSFDEARAHVDSWQERSESQRMVKSFAYGVIDRLEKAFNLRQREMSTA